MDKLMELWERYRPQVMMAGIVLVIVGVCLWQKSGQQQLPAASTNTVIASKSTSENASHGSPRIVTVDVKGAVKQPGVYQLKSDSRVNEALNAAGGPLATADLRQVNRAQQLEDQQVIYVPTAGETPPAAATGASSQVANNGPQEKVNLNTATKEQLCQINGIGDKKADLILQYRQEHGQFTSLDELKEINGFGEKTVAKLKDSLSI